MKTEKMTGRTNENGVKMKEGIICLSFNFIPFSFFHFPTE
jgi:hypothetical protein